MDSFKSTAVGALGIAAKPPELVDDVACLIKGSSCTLGPGQQKFPIPSWPLSR